MKYFLFLFAGLFAVTGSVFAQPADLTTQERNKEIARKFYEDLWFSNNTGNYDLYVADEFVVHDIGDRKNSVEPAIRQKEIADFFWKNGELSGEINYQIAEGDLVATRWHGVFKPKTMFGKLAIRETDFYIINVLRIEDGKIVEFWNHRHDIDTSQTDKFVFKGFGVGVAFTLLVVLLVSFLRRKRSRAT